MIERTVAETSVDCVDGGCAPRRNEILTELENSTSGGIIELYSQPTEGYHPFLIRDGWQVAQLNYMPTLRMSGIQQLDRHLATDEVFILIAGAPVLIAAEETPTGLCFAAVRMRSGITYNVPKGRWHNITMRLGDSVIIVEKSLTHCGDVEYRALSSSERRQLRAIVREARTGGRK